MNNSAKGTSRGDKAQKKSGYPFADSLADASSAIRRLGNGCKQHNRRARRPRLGCDFVRQQGFCDPRSPACRDEVIVLLYERNQRLDGEAEKVSSEKTTVDGSPV